MSELFTNVSNGKQLVGNAITDVDRGGLILPLLILKGVESMKIKKWRMSVLDDRPIKLRSFTIEGYGRLTKFILQ